MTTKINPEAGYHTKPNIWDKMRGVRYVDDRNEPIDPGVNYFLAVLNSLGLETSYSCEGHPYGFYIVFEANYQQALDIHSIGYFSVELEREFVWSIRKIHSEWDRGGPKDKVDHLRYAAKAWNEKFKIDEDLLWQALDSRFVRR